MQACARIISVVMLAWAGVAHAAPSIVSAGMCADQMVLSVAAPSQIIALTKAAADSELSPYIEKVEVQKARTLSTERLLFEKPDLVITDEFTSPLARQMYAKLNVETFDIPHLATLGDVQEWQGKLADRLKQPRPKAFAIPAQQTPKHVTAAIYRPGGYSPGQGTTMDYILTHAGYDNLSSTLGFQGTRAMSLETLVYHHPELLITDAKLEGKYKFGFAPLVLKHPVIEARVKEALYIPLAQWFCLTPKSVEAYEKLAFVTPRLSRGPDPAMRRDDMY